MSFDETSRAIRRWFGEAVKAVDPERAVASRLAAAGERLTIAGRDLDVPGRVVVVAIGKAAVPMARAAEERLGDRISVGIALTKDDHASGPPLRRIEVREASHPIPDERGVAATRAILDLVEDLIADDLVLALISGGGSALFEAPVEDVTLDDIAATTKLLLHAGAPIQDLNAVRIPLSRVKGGGLRAAAPGTRFATLILSDVLGNDPRVIASGPTVSSDATGDAALALLDRYGVRGQTPPSVVKALERFAPRPFDATDDVVEIVADNASAVRAFADAAERDGRSTRVAWIAKEGEARELAEQWVDLLADAAERVLVGGGEATVTVRGDGEGGRNTEFALAAGLELERRGLTDWAVASLATDGQDANTGMAGAIASAETIAKARAAGVDPEAALDRNDSLAAFRSAGGLVETGPTGTNVNDIYVAARIH